MYDRVFLGLCVHSLPIVEQSLHQASDGGDQGDPTLPPGLSLNLLQQAEGQMKRGRTRQMEREDQKRPDVKGSKWGGTRRLGGKKKKERRKY